MYATHAAPSASTPGSQWQVISSRNCCAPLMPPKPWMFVNISEVPEEAGSTLWRTQGPMPFQIPTITAIAMAGLSHSGYAEALARAHAMRVKQGEAGERADQAGEDVKEEAVAVEREGLLAIEGKTDQRADEGHEQHRDAHGDHHAACSTESAQNGSRVVARPGRVSRYLHSRSSSLARVETASAPYFRRATRRSP